MLLGPAINSLPIMPGIMMIAFLLTFTVNVAEQILDLCVAVTVAVPDASPLMVCLSLSIAMMVESVV